MAALRLVIAPIIPSARVTFRSPTPCSAFKLRHPGVRLRAVPFFGGGSAALSEGESLSRPRFVLVLGYRVGDRLTPPWPGAGRPLDGAIAARSWVAWRLLGSNHRELARSASVFADVAACNASISQLRSGLEQGAATVSVEAVERMWGWVVRVDAGALAVASRLYLRQRECEYSCQVFLGAAGHADLPTTPPAPRNGSAIEVRVAAE